MFSIKGNLPNLDSTYHSLICILVNYQIDISFNGRSDKNK